MIMPRGKNETDEEWRRTYFWPTLIGIAMLFLAILSLIFFL